MIEIPTQEIKQDIADTQSEIDDYASEIEILSKRPMENRTRIYLLQGRISQRKSFIDKLNQLLKERELKKL